MLCEECQFMSYHYLNLVKLHFEDIQGKHAKVIEICEEELDKLGKAQKFKQHHQTAASFYFQYILTMFLSKTHHLSFESSLATKLYKVFNVYDLLEKAYIGYCFVPVYNFICTYLLLTEPMIQEYIGLHLRLMEYLSKVPSINYAELLSVSIQEFRKRNPYIMEGNISCIVDVYFHKFKNAKNPYNAFFLCFML